LRMDVDDKVPVSGTQFSHEHGLQAGGVLFVFCAMGGKFLGGLMFGALAYVLAGLIGAILIDVRERREERERSTRLGGGAPTLCTVRSGPTGGIHEQVRYLRWCERRKD
jgi:hypothetical protein